MTKDAQMMSSCLRLAEQGRGFVSPNPLVGCVVVKKGEVVGQGYHARFGGPHAEVVALRRAGRRAQGATLFVNLEPCAHHGKTPPCVDAIVASGISKVVVAMTDPNPLVSGRGIRRLRRSGIEVNIGAMRPEAERLNEKFANFMKKGRPFVGIKVAQTLDSRISDIHGVSRWITSAASRRFVHRLRTEYDAVLVGAETVRKDDPELTVRYAKGRNPVRVVLDGRLLLSAQHKIFRDGLAPTIILTNRQAFKRRSRAVREFQRVGVEVVVVSKAPVLSARDILKTLADRGISSVLVEGGGRTISAFLEERLGDRLYCFVAPKLLGAGVSGFQLRPRLLDTSIKILEPQYHRFQDDIMIEGRLRAS